MINRKICPDCNDYAATILQEEIAALRGKVERLATGNLAAQHRAAKENAALRDEVERLKGEVEHHHDAYVEEARLHDALRSRVRVLEEAVEWALIYFDLNPDTLDAEFMKVFRRKAGRE